MYSVRNINNEHDSQLSFGDRVADRVASVMGSWHFIIMQSILLIIWILLNTIAFIAHWDSYPYVLLNLALSFQAAFATPVILMSQNRQSSKDRLMAEHDYEINMRAFNHLSDQDNQLLLSLEKHDKQIEMLQLGNNELAEQTKMLIRLLQDKNKLS